MEIPAAKPPAGRDCGVGGGSKRPHRHAQGEHGERPCACSSKAVAGDFETSEGRGLAQDGLKALLGGSKPADIAAKTVDALRALSALLDAKAPSDAAAYKTWLCHVANAVAEAAPEGGFLGFGGAQVSEAEKASVAQIATALGVSVPAGT